MASRKCPFCSLKFHCNYIQRHMLNCRDNLNNASDSSESGDCDQNVITDDEEVEKIKDTTILNDSILMMDDDGETTVHDHINEHVIYNDDEFQNFIYNDSYEDNMTVNLNNSDLLPDPNKLFLLQWLCIFIALWQSFFNISDNAIELVIHFLKVFFAVLAEHFNVFAGISIAMPSSVYMLNKFLGRDEDQDNFIKYVVCIKCFNLYDLSECHYIIRGVQHIKNCNKVAFPNHPRKQFRKPCGQPLLRKISSRSGKECLMPFKTYCYVPLKKSLQRLFKYSDFLKNCNLWRNRPQRDDILSDIYDGAIWKEFEDLEGMNFFHKEENLALMLNVDWFCPFKHVRSVSIGAIYAVFLNLPRELRFKKEFMILVGIIPNMAKEPPTNTFLHPFIDELLTAWHDGIEVQSADGSVVSVKCALLCVGCDIPASRKLCGFLGHSATKGCNKCQKSFPGPFGNVDYSGFDRENWTARTNADHRKQMDEIGKCNTLGEKEKLESKYGTRFTVLSLLPYFDAIRMTAVDPMHNLFLGTSKRMLQIWKDNGILTKRDLEEIQVRLDKCSCPNDVGRLPSKLNDTSLDVLTADEIKNWTILFSQYVLKDFLPDRHYKCWNTFVLACGYICNQALVEADLHIIDHLLLKFCKEFEIIYGKDLVTPNMHIHGHLIDSIKDFGPVYNFWLFSFERYNGLLGSKPNNKKGIEAQITRRLLRDQSSIGFTYPIEHRTEFSKVLNRMDIVNQHRGEVGKQLHDVLDILMMASRRTDYRKMKWFTNVLSYDVPKKRFVHNLDDMQFRCLKSMYSCVYPNAAVQYVSRSCWKFREVSLHGVTYGSSDSRSFLSSFVLAHWCGHDGEVQPYESMETTARPGKILFFVKHNIKMHNRSQEHLLAFVEWLLPAPAALQSSYPKPIQVFSASFFEIAGAASFIPVQRLKCKFVYARETIAGNDYFIILPRDRYLHL